MKLTAISRIDLTKSLVGWYQRHKRALPWRNTKEPYHIWLSEVMLQQTRVSTVVPYYEGFLKKFPKLEDLASASEQSVLQAWSGLGYYRRARHLQDAARQIVSKWNGQFPEEYDVLRTLPGFGPYIAAAVSSIAFDRKHAAVDGNVLRVLARLLDEKGDITRITTQRKLSSEAHLLVETVDPFSAGTWNQAMMELGATVCIPKGPKCSHCPINYWCCSRRAGTQKFRPTKTQPRTKEKITVSVIACEQDGEILIRQRPADARLMPSFWELPEVQGPSLCQADIKKWGLKNPKELGKLSHSITFRIYSISVFIADLRKEPPEGFFWVSRQSLRKLPLTTITRKVLSMLGSNPPVNVKPQ